MDDVGRIAVAARVFTLAALSSIAVLLESANGYAPLLLLLAVAFAMGGLALTARVPESWIALAEGGLVGALAVTTYPTAHVVIPYLAIPALIGGLSGGVPGVLRTQALESIVIIGCWLAVIGHGDATLAAELVLWMVTGLGFGLFGAFFRSRALSPAADENYRGAVELIKQLRALSDKLTAGLDPVSLAEGVMARAESLIPVHHAAVYVRSHAGVVAPLRHTDGAASDSFRGAERLVLVAWDSRTPVLRERRAFLPLQAQGQVVAMLVLDCVEAVNLRAVALLRESLAPESLQLHAALLFDEVRSRATSEERQRLAREVHDGVAQDVASLGYLVDNLCQADDETRRTGLAELRGEVTRVVTELRHSVFDLRNEVGVGRGLGESLSSFARHIGSRSDLTVHLTLDEAGTRLRRDVESELLRIGQEAMNNARKHSCGRNLWVSCVVHPPYAEITVTDDGRGIQGSRVDAHGMRIMAERAEKIAAVLEVASVDGGGTRLLVSVGAPSDRPVR